MRSIFFAILTLLLLTCGHDNPITPRPGEDPLTVLHTYGGNNRDEGFSMTPTSDGGYAVTGYSSSDDGDFKGINQGGRDVFILRVDSNGNQQWIKTIGGSSTDQGFSMTPTSDGGFAITGWSSSSDGDFTGLNQGSTDIFILKVDSEGNQEWLKTFGGSNADRGYSLIQSADGGYVITGWSASNDGDFSGLFKGDTDIFILKVDSNGNQEWVKSFGGSKEPGGAFDVSYSLAQTSDGTIAITGLFGSIDGDFLGLNRGGSDIFILEVKNETGFN